MGSVFLGQATLAAEMLPHRIYHIIMDFTEAPRLQSFKLLSCLAFPAPSDSCRWAVLFWAPLLVFSIVKADRYIRIFISFWFLWASRNLILYLTSLCLLGFAWPRPSSESGGVQLLWDVCCRHCQRTLSFGGVYWQQWNVFGLSFNVFQQIGIFWIL